MMSDRDIWLAAKARIARYGSNAEIEAAERADKHLEKRDPEGSGTWQRIMTTIEKLQAEKPEPGEAMQ
jgi:vacuolar-type H+-ATPase subunit H